MVYVDAMTQINVMVIMGRQKWEFIGHEQMKFMELRHMVEAKAGTVEGGIRLLHKGKSLSDNETFASVNVTSGTKMMGLRTAKQREEEKNREKNAKLISNRTAMDELKDKVGKPETEGASASSSTGGRTLRGDAAIEGSDYVVLIKGKDKYRVNIDLSESVVAVKNKATSMEGIKSEARDMRLLFKGKFLQNDINLDEAGVKRGASLMLLFSARHHDAKEGFTEISSIEKKLEALEKETRAVASKANHRLLYGADLTVEKARLSEAVGTLKDNLFSVRKEDERRAELNRRLAEVEVTIEGLLG